MSKLQLFDSLEKKLIQLNFNSQSVINIYLCGPTVYDHIHLGNLRPTIIFDVLHRLLLNRGLKVNYIQNITDIDDKIIAKAQQEKKSESEISKHFTKAYLNNLYYYNILFPTFLPRVTNYIPQIQNFIASLLEKGLAYQQAGEIFFSLSGKEKYGKLSGQNLEKLQSVRTINQSNKADNKDFLLWKKTEKGLTWNSPWGLGRPGWHTECVVFIQELFGGKTIDIHGGGNDLLFPHHENERIQFLAANNRELSKIWLHIAHIHYKKEKMSKSLSNTIFAKHFFQKYGANVLRYLILNTHYNQVINLEEKLIQQAVDYINKIQNLLTRINFYLYDKKINLTKSDHQETTIQKEVIQHLANNLHTVKVFYLLEKNINLLNKQLDKEKSGEEIKKEINDFYFILNILGFKFNFPTYDLSVRLLIKNWQKLRTNKQYFQADQIRKKLQQKNII